jgi:hypothetical protein
MSNPSLHKLLDRSAMPAQLKRCEAAFGRLYPSVPLEFIIKTCLGLSQSHAQVRGGYEIRVWADLCQFDSTWKLDWNLVHNRFLTTGEWACTIEADSLWFASETGDAREPLENWQRAG